MKRVVHGGKGQADSFDRARAFKGAKSGRHHRRDWRLGSAAIEVAKFSGNMGARTHAIKILSEIRNGKNREKILSNIALDSAYEDTREDAAGLVLDVPQVTSEEGLLVVALKRHGGAAMEAVMELAYSDSLYAFHDNPEFHELFDDDGSGFTSEMSRLINIAENLIRIMAMAVDKQVSAFAERALAKSRFFAVAEDVEALLEDERLKGYPDENSTPKTASSKEFAVFLWGGYQDYVVDGMPEHEARVLDDLKKRS